MAFDNILALFLLPLFGKLSDRTRTRLGRRTPYILFGTLAAVTAFFFLSVADMMQLRLLGDAARINDPYGLQLIYRAEKKTELISPEGETFVLQDTFSEDEFKTIRTRIYPENNVAMANPLFTQVVVPAGQAYARRVTHENGQILILFIYLLLATLVAMATFRSPAVALMPDVTLKPLRSRANAIITLMLAFTRCGSLLSPMRYIIKCLTALHACSLVGIVRHVSPGCFSAPLVSPMAISFSQSGEMYLYSLLS